MPIAKVFLDYSSRGHLVPDEPTVKLWRQAIENATRAGQFRPETDTLVLDGIPRNAHQAQMLRDTLKVVAVFYLKSNKVESLIARMQKRALKENRLDDANLETIRERFLTYERETKPVLNFYGSKTVHKINADQPPAKVLMDILRHIERK